MARSVCTACSRPQAACICSFITSIDNKVPVVILQHPSEVKQTKGTVTLLAQSLSNCQVIIGEDFSQDEDLNNILANYHCVLLYPSDQASELTEQYIGQIGSNKPLCLVMLDGTWKKAYRMYMLSKNLQNIPSIALPQHLADAGQYLIRKVAKANALSTLEACCYGLAIIENYLVDEDMDTDIVQVMSISAENAGNYQVLLNKFAQFNQFQLSFVPK